MKLQEYDIPEAALMKAVDEGVRRAKARRMPRRAMLLAACMLVLAVGSIAVAQLLYGSVDWRGRPIREEWIEAPDETPGPADAEVSLRDDWVDAWADSKPENEYWIAQGEESGHLFAPSEQVDSADEIAERARTSGLLTPGYIPAGYSFHSATLSFYFTPEQIGKTSLISRETGPYGLTLYKYRPDPALSENVQGYSMDYKNAQGDRLTLWAALSSKTNTYSFGLQPGVDHSVEQVSGMDEAFLYHYLNDDHLTLYTLKRGLPAIRVATSEYDAFPGATHPEEYSSVTYDQAEYGIWAQGISKADILQIAQSLK